jgi:FKBP-type peptidyl-prolyl cis-trans isomerase
MKVSSVSCLLCSLVAVQQPHGSFGFQALQARSCKQVVRTTRALSVSNINGDEFLNNQLPSTGVHHTSRRSVVQRVIVVASVLAGAASSPHRAVATTTNRACTDIESCRELGEQKVQKDLQENPRVKLDSGVRYKVLQPGTGVDESVVREGSTVDLIYSVNKPGIGYMYSQGLGYEKIDIGDGKIQSDLGIDSLRVKMGRKDVPEGIEQALLGMKRGERRRVELPASVGFETSDWKPVPTTKRGEAALSAYRNIVEGRGPNQPPFPAATIWDVEVLRIR